MRPALNYALHPYWPVRLGFRKALKFVNPQAADLLEKTDGLALSTPRARISLLRECRDVLQRKVPGEFVEFGVHRGGTAAILATAIIGKSNRRLHLFDRWGDLPEPTEEDGFRKEAYARANRMDRIALLHDSLDSTKYAVEVLASLPAERVTYYQGWFNDTIGQYPGKPIAFASIDTDYYESTVPALELCERYASRGATFFIDDFGAWPGAERATREFIARTKRKVHLSPTPTGQAVVAFLD